MEASKLLDRTPGAARPNDDSAGELAAFGDRQTGQLDKANLDKDGAKAILRTCEAWKRKSAEEAERKLKPWYRRMF